MSATSRRYVLVTVMGAFGLLALGAGTAWACLPQAQVTVSPDTASPGDRVIVEGQYFNGNPVPVYWGPTGDELAVAEEANFSAAVTVPEDAPAGVHVVTAHAHDRDGAQVGQSSAPLTVAEEESESATGPQLPLACPIGEVPPAGFTDRGEIPEAHRLQVDCAAWREVVAGFPDDTFRPALFVRRDQMATFLAGTLQAAGVELPERGPRFHDVDADSPHEEAIHRLAGAGVIHGGASGLDTITYMPTAPVRRDQLATLVLRAVEFAADEDLARPTPTFDDVPEGNVHFENVNGAAAFSHVRGFPDGTYRPAAAVRRDELDTSVMRVLDHLLQMDSAGA